MAFRDPLSALLLQLRVNSNFWQLHNITIWLLAFLASISLIVWRGLVLALRRPHHAFFDIKTVHIGKVSTTPTGSLSEGHRTWWSSCILRRKLWLTPSWWKQIDHFVGSLGACNDDKLMTQILLYLPRKRLSGLATNDFSKTTRQCTIRHQMANPSFSNSFSSTAAA